MTLRELINQVTDNDANSPALDYELDFFNLADSDKCYPSIGFISEDEETKSITIELVN